MEGHPQLLVIGGPAGGRAISLDRDEVTFGRDRSNVVTFAWDRSVSRQHARIVRHSGLWWLEDLGSKRGTFLQSATAGEHQISAEQPELLLDGMTIRLGLVTQLRVQGTYSSTRTAAQALYLQLENSLHHLRSQLSLLQVAERQERLKQVQNLVRRLAACKNEDDLLQLASRGIPLFVRADDSLDVATAGALPELPPLPDDLPDPGTVHRLRSVLNVFIVDVDGMLEEGSEADDE